MLLLIAIKLKTKILFRVPLPVYIVPFFQSLQDYFIPLHIDGVKLEATVNTAYEMG